MGQTNKFSVQKALAEGAVKRVEVGRDNGSLLWSLSTFGIARVSFLESEWLEQIFGENIEVVGKDKWNTESFYIAKMRKRVVLQNCTVRSATLANFRYSISISIG